MSLIKDNYLYTRDHEWLKKTATPKVVLIGITDFAQSSLGDITYLQLPEVGKTLKKGEIFGTVESVKAVSDLYAPVSGVVKKRNDTLLQDPAAINTDPFESAWMLEIEMTNESESAELLSPGAYEKIAQ
jgi:glycine cleavage system H protein